MNYERFGSSAIQFQDVGRGFCSVGARNGTCFTGWSPGGKTESRSFPATPDLHRGKQITGTDGQSMSVCVQFSDDIYLDLVGVHNLI